jgi:hypothetical protein
MFYMFIYFIYKWSLSSNNHVVIVYRFGFSYIVAVSFIGGGNRSTRRNLRPVAGRWQTLSHYVVLHLALIEIRTHNISGDRHRRSWHGINPPPFFSNFLFTYLFSIQFLYFFIISSLFPYFNLFVSIYSYNIMLTATYMFRSQVLVARTTPLFLTFCLQIYFQ